LRNWLVSFRTAVLTAVAAFLYRVLSYTWRYDSGDPPAILEASLRGETKLVVGHFHEDEFALLKIFLKRPLVVMVSLSKDGALMSALLKRFNFTILRGSSSRNASAALIGMIHQVEAGMTKTVGLAVDGPRGPRRKCKLGMFKLAERLDAPILTGSIAADRAWVFRKSWSRAFIPKPFARVKIVYSPLLPASEIKKYAARDDFLTLSLLVEDQIRNAKRVAEKEVSSRS